MGTNYYALFDLCSACKGYGQRLHIGKSSLGWRFTFRGYRAQDGYSPPITSYKDWLRVLSMPGVIITDGYERNIPLEKFKEFVKSKRSAKSGHVEYCKKDKTIGEEYLKQIWLDEEGYDFIGDEFS